MKVVEQLRAISSRDDFAKFLGYSPSGFAYIVYRQSDAAKYTEFRIKKRSGGDRIIHAPEPKLKQLQKKLASVLAQLDRESLIAAPVRVLSHGFRPGFSIFTNAKEHVGVRHVLNIDIEDFFPSFNFGRVRGFLIKNKDFRLPPLVATLICQIAFREGTLPQGSPCSPILTNIVGRFLDVELVRVSRRYGCRYSRYADDISISTNQKAFPQPLAARQGENHWVAGRHLVAAISRAGFKINHEKTRLSTRTGRQTVTGLTVNRFVNVPSGYYRYARSMAHSMFRTGSYLVPPDAMRKRDRAKIRRSKVAEILSKYVPERIIKLWHVAGLKARLVLRQLFSVAPPKVEVAGEAAQGSAATMMQRLEGILGYTAYVRGLGGRDAPSTKEDENPKPDKYTGARKLYRRFLFFKHFYVNNIPTIITEGPTDIVYLKAAIRNLVKKYPRLASIDGSKFELKVKFLRHTKSTTEILGLSGGTDPIKKLVLEYDSMLSKFAAPRNDNPVIIVIDNDDGANGIYGVLANKFKTAPMSVSTGVDATNVTDNLYLTSTPAKGAKGSSCIEDLFPPAVLAIKIDGKSFHYATNKIDEKTQYGKAAFAHNVVLKDQAAIDFSGFEPLLNNIVLAMDMHAARVAKAPKVTA